MRHKKKSDAEKRTELENVQRRSEEKRARSRKECVNNTRSEKRAVTMKLAQRLLTATTNKRNA